jgi:hypothetical protein
VVPVTFYGKWSLEVVGNDSQFEERVRIVGLIVTTAAPTNPTQLLVIGATVGTKVAAIDAPSWDVFVDLSADGGATWETNLIQRIPSATPQDGLIVTLFAKPDSVIPQLNMVTVKFKYLNTQVNPPGPSTPPFGFTLPPSSFRPPGPPRARTKVAVVSRLEIHGKTPF